jgi:hypothetical protein
VRVIGIRRNRAVEDKMHRIIRGVGEILLFVLLTLVVTGVWVGLWLPPY